MTVRQFLPLIEKERRERVPQVVRIQPVQAGSSAHLFEPTIQLRFDGLAERVLRTQVHGRAEVRRVLEILRLPFPLSIECSNRQRRDCVGQLPIRRR
jgi:hypothetical protein